MSTAFLLMRITAGLSSLAALGMIALVLFLRDAASTAKQGFKVLGFVTQLFASAFTEGTAPPEQPSAIGLWPIMIAVAALLMGISVFTPQTRWFLHAVAIVAALIIGSYARMFSGGVELEILCLPFLIVWFGYYAMTFTSLQPVPILTTPTP